MSAYQTRQIDGVAGKKSILFTKSTICNASIIFILVAMLNAKQKRPHAQRYLHRKQEANNPPTYFSLSLSLKSALMQTEDHRNLLSLDSSRFVALLLRLLRSGFFLELADVLLDSRVESSFQLRPVAEHEQNFQPDEERGEEECLDQVVEQSWGTTLEDTVADELSHPGEDVDAKGDVVGRCAVG